MNKTNRPSIRERFLKLFDEDFHEFGDTQEEYKRPNRILVSKWTDRSYKILSVISTVILIGFLLYVVSQSPDFGDPNNPAMNEVAVRYIVRGPQETGAANTIAGMILDYRAFDTFGEALMMFTAAQAVISVLRKSFNEGGREKKHEVN